MLRNITSLRSVPEGNKISEQSVKINKYAMSEHVWRVRRFTNVYSLLFEL